MDIIMKKIYKGWRSLHLFTRTLIGFGIGVTLGVILGPQASIFEFLGTILLRLINMVVAPLVLCLLISAAADINDYRTLGKIGVKTIAVFMVTTIFAVIVGMFFALTFKVGKGVAITNEGLEATTDVIVPSIVDTLINIIPNNIFEALSESNLLQIIFFALIFGLALSKLKEKGILVNKVIYGCRDAMLNITNMVLEITPLGVMGIMANVVGKYGIKILLPYGIISVLKETERKMQYQEYDLKAEQAVLDRKTGRVSILPGREDSLDRMMEAGLFPDRGEQDIEAEICSRLQYEKLHRAIRQLEKREQYLIIQLFFCGRSERELAGELCVSQNAINKQRGRILQKLRKILQNLSF